MSFGQRLLVPEGMKVGWIVSTCAECYFLEWQTDYWQPIDTFRARRSQHWPVRAFVHIQMHSSCSCLSSLEMASLSIVQVAPMVEVDV